MEKRLENLEWETEKRDRGRWRNNILIREMNVWAKKQGVKEFTSENLMIETEISRAFKLLTERDRYIMVAEVANWEQKREIMAKKKEREFLSMTIWQGGNERYSDI